MSDIDPRWYLSDAELDGLQAWAAEQRQRSEEIVAACAELRRLRRLRAERRAMSDGRKEAP